MKPLNPAPLHRVVALAAALIAGPASAAQLSISSYSYSPGPSSIYPDSGQELTNGITYSAAWTVPSTTITPSQVTQLVGWQNTEPTITLNFAAPVTIREVRAWFADSDNSAGVGVPNSVTLFNTGLGFSETFSITNPPGNGSTVEFIFTGFEVTTNQLRFTFDAAKQWTMLSEIQVFDTSSIPEPSTYAVALGGFALVAAAGSRRRRASRR
jgi:hypothetical protein